MGLQTQRIQVLGIREVGPEHCEVAIAAEVDNVLHDWVNSCLGRLLDFRLLNTLKKLLQSLSIIHPVEL